MDDLVKEERLVEFFYRLLCVMETNYSAAELLDACDRALDKYEFSQK